MAERKYYLFSKIAVITICGLMVVELGFAKDKAKPTIILSPADMPLWIKLSSCNLKDKIRKLDREDLEQEQISLSELKHRLAKEAIYKSKSLAEDRNWWYLSLPLGTITKALDSAEAFREYLSRAFSAETKVKVSEKEIGFCIKKKF